MNLTTKNSRLECGKEIEKLMGIYKNLIHLTTDGNDYTHKHRSRHFDVGIAEGNLIGIAAGIAIKDMPVIINGITSFIVTNALMQIRDDLCFPNLQVIMLGIGSGISYASLGFTHHSFEDIGLLSNLPNIKIYLPADAMSARKALSDAVNRKGPSYIRVRTGNELVVYQKSLLNKLDFSGPVMVADGKDAVVFTYGVHVKKLLEIRDTLKVKGISIRVVDVNSIDVYPRILLLDMVENHKKAYVVEEHCFNTGLGSMIANLFVENNKKTPLIKLGLPKEFCEIAGSAEELLNHYNLGVDDIESIIVKSINE